MISKELPQNSLQISRRGFILGTLGAALPMVLGACAKNERIKTVPPKPIRYGLYSGNSPRIAFVVAKQKNLFEKCGIAVEPYDQRNFFDGLVTGNIDVIDGNPLASIQFDIRQKKTELLSFSTLQRSNPTVLVTNKEGVSEGDVVATGGPPGGNPDNIAKLQLWQLGVDTRKLKYTGVPNPIARYQALRNSGDSLGDKVDVAQFTQSDWDFLKHNLQAKAATVIPNASKAGAANLLTRAEFLNSRLDDLVKLSKALIEANRFILSLKGDGITQVAEMFFQYNKAYGEDRSLAFARDYRSTLVDWSFAPDKETVTSIAAFWKHEGLDISSFRSNEFAPQTVANRLKEDGF